MYNFRAAFSRYERAQNDEVQMNAIDRSILRKLQAVQKKRLWGFSLSWSMSLQQEPPTPTLAIFFKKKFFFFLANILKQK